MEKPCQTENVGPNCKPPYTVIWFTFALFTKALKLNALATRDEDGLDTVPLGFDWTCENDSGEACISQAGTALDIRVYHIYHIIQPSHASIYGRKYLDDSYVPGMM